MPTGRLEQSGLNRAWTETSAALLNGWELRGRVLGPRVADPAIDGAHWVAWTRAKDDSKDAELPLAEGGGETRQTLNDLAKRLRELRR